MKKLRLTTEEQELLLQDIIEKYAGTGKYDITSFEYTKTDVKEFLESIQETQTKKPTIKITMETYTKMYELVKQSDIELQWHMLVERDIKNQIYTVYDVLLFPQTNTGTSTTSDQDEFAKWISKLMMDPEFPFEDLRGHGHSHVNMNVYSSGVDDAYQRDLITKVGDDDFYLFLVLNKKMEMYALLYDFHQQLMFNTNDINIEIINNSNEDIKKWCAAQIKENCKTLKTKYTPPYKSPNYTYPKSSLKIDNQPEDEYVFNLNSPFNRRRR